MIEKIVIQMREKKQISKIRNEKVGIKPITTNFRNHTFFFKKIPFHVIVKCKIKWMNF